MKRAPAHTDNFTFFIFKFDHDSSYEVTNVSVSYQLLEKSRVCSDASTSGSNFHIFYLLAEHATEQMKKDLQLHGEFKVKLFFNS